jgi:hypothetical protein
MNDLDYERWRGSIDARLLLLKEGQDKIPDHIEQLGERFEIALRRHVDHDEKVEEDHNKRIATLETKQSRLLGQLAIFGTMFTTIIAAAAAAAAKYALP